MREQEQVIVPTGFRIGAGHVEAAERVNTDERSGGFEPLAAVPQDKIAVLGGIVRLTRDGVSVAP